VGDKEKNSGTVLPPPKNPKRVVVKMIMFETQPEDSQKEMKE
jgi:hypothetical protein